MTEQQKYKVLKRLDDLEIREYEPCVLMQVSVRGDFMRAGNIGFGPLVRFISGGNESRQKIAMTAPVLQAQKEDGFITSFVMPASMSMSEMPSSPDRTLSFSEQPGGKFAAISFSGLASQPLFDSKAQSLRKQLDAKQIVTAGPAIYARYDGPWTPFFLRHNEVLIPLQG